MDLQEKRLAFASVAVVSSFLVLIALVATIGGGLESHDWSEVTIADIDISAEALDIAEASLNVTTYLDNSGDANSGEINISVKAYDADTNLLVTSTKTKVGKIEGRETKSASTYLKLPKEGGYRLQIVVFEDDKGIQRAETMIYGLTSLEPPSVAKISIREIDFFVEAVEAENAGNREYAVINTTLYVDNLGKDVSDLRVLIKARENETKLIADKRWGNLGFLKEGTTSLHYAELRVLNGRDYIFEVQVWQSERVIKESSGMVLLSPFANRTVVLESKEKTVEISPGIKISDFARPSWGYEEEGYEAPIPRPMPAAPEEPDFEVLPAAFALLIAFVLLLKKRRGGI
ncbi:MAG TPA: hypothetical protein VMW40_02770 [Candidatus Bathyarchaeia archaeon]|nr:hypothetical protein [Candidatus Bathyarchaeia archaeon]